MWQIGRFIGEGLGGVTQIVNEAKNSFHSANSLLNLLIFHRVQCVIISQELFF